MNGITVSMAIIDFIPVLLFFFATLILQRDFYGKMVKGAYALLATGSYMVLIGGIFKALWKILYAANVCDYPLLEQSFFPLQGPGFLLVFIAFIGLFTKYNRKDAKLLGVGIVPVYTSSMPFVIMQIIGCSGTQWSLFAIAVKLKKAAAAVLYVVSFIFMLGMGYLSAKFDDSASMHWVAQTVNIVSQGTFLLGTVLLHRGGLRDWTPEKGKTEE